MDEEKNKADLIIIGSGPAGLNSAIHGAMEGLKTVVFEAEAFGGLAGTVPTIENYPGFESISGFELTEKMKKQAEACGAEFIFDRVKQLNPEELSITTSETVWKAKAIIIATGSNYKKLGIPKEADLEGNGISYCATCDGPLFRNKVITVVGDDRDAAVEAIYLSHLAREVNMIVKGHRVQADQHTLDKLEKINNIKFFTRSVVEEAMVKRDRLRKLKIYNLDTKEHQTIKTRAIFVAVGKLPDSELAKEANITIDDAGYIIVDKDQQTNFEGIYAAGDVTGGIYGTTTAVGESTIAVKKALEFIQQKYNF